MENDDSLAYAEVDAILNLLEEDYLNKIPEKVRDFFREEKDSNYKPIIRTDIPLEEQSLRRTTGIIFAILNLNYWCESEEEKQEILNEFAQNEQKKIKEQEELYNKYNPDNLFKNRRNNNIQNIEEELNENISLIKYKKQSFIKRIFEKIAVFFKKR